MKQFTWASTSVKRGSTFICTQLARVSAFPTAKRVSGACARTGRLQVALVIVEATGKLHRLVHRVLSQAGYLVAAVNPQRPREFAKSIGQLAKTDGIDADSRAFWRRHRP